MKLTSIFAGLIVLFSHLSLQASEPLKTSSLGLATDSLQGEHETLFYRVADNVLLQRLYSEIFGISLGESFMWLNIISQNPVNLLSENDYLVLENNRIGGFDLYNDADDFVKVAPNLEGLFSLESGNGSRVQAKNGALGRLYFQTDRNKQFSLGSRISIGGKQVLKADNGYEITLKGKLNGGSEIRDNEGRKLQVKLDRSGILTLMDDDQILKTLFIHNVQSFTIEEANGQKTDIRMRGRFNDIIINYSDGREVFIKNRFRKSFIDHEDQEVHSSK